MYWILRRTGAANFFNSLNNNCSTSKGGNASNTTQDKYVKRPPRKAYGRLSADSDDASSMKQQIDDPFDDIDNFEIIASANKRSAAKQANCRAAAGICSRTNDGGGGTTGDGARGEAGSQNSDGCSPDCQGNCVVSCEACDGGASSTASNGNDGANGNGNTGANTNNNNTTTGPATTPVSSGGVFGGFFKSYTSSSHKEINENTINRLQAMAMSDDDDDDDDDLDSLCCNVCDRAFHCHRQLASHQQKKRHFACSACDSLFPSLMLLEHHKEEFEHWTEEEIRSRLCCRRNRGDDYFTDTDSFTSEAESEDLERLL